ncbi:MAG: bifunctional phosphoribosyl-AMP cyclohydrolase/phosphoribosyl-ATP diphosphatase HisIE [Sporomusaceae bacterium]|nr:bifunctional phosphoribosyl-AMP cyclohydrolase/phosphoribosyl-ATP diphosphatase HisIE [Sporomusaceae bacterium]
MNLDMIKFDDKGLVPAVIQDAHTQAVLMLAYMNRESLAKTLESGLTWFYSRSRGCLWQKGETSGHIQRVKSIRYDCDGDALLLAVEQKGPACHEGTYSCFSRTLSAVDTGPAGGDAAKPASRPAAVVLQELYEVILDRKAHRREGSYTNYLFDKGQDKILKKVGEEAAETIIASKNQDKAEILYEMADLWYHCLVLLGYHSLTPAELLTELQDRRK